MSKRKQEIKGSILKQGWLLKRSKHLKQWKNRWVIITDECMLYSFRNRSDNKPSLMVNLREFPIHQILSNEHKSNKLSSKKLPLYQKRKRKHRKQIILRKQTRNKVLENKIIQLSSSDPNNKTVHQFKTLMHFTWMNILDHCQNIIHPAPNTKCLFIQTIPKHVLSTIIASCLYSYERFILCRISKWFYSIFNINEYNFIYHYYSDCLYWNRNLQQYISTSSSSSSSSSSSHSYHQQICTLSSLNRYNNNNDGHDMHKQSISNLLHPQLISSVNHHHGDTKEMYIDLSNGNLAHLLNDKTKRQQFKYYMIAYDQIIHLQKVSHDRLCNKLTLKQKMCLKEAYSLVFKQRKLLPSYIHKQQQRQLNCNMLYRLKRPHSALDVSYHDDFRQDMTQYMIPSNINGIHLSGNKKDFQRYHGMKWLYSILLSNNSSSSTAMNPLSTIHLDDNLLTTDDIKLFVQALWDRTTSMDNLQHLYLNANPQIMDTMESMELLFECIGQKCPNLQHLSLRRIASCNDQILKIIVNFYKKYHKITRLTTISLVGCSNITLEGVNWLNKNLWNLQNRDNHSLFSNIDILLNIPKTQIIKHHHQNRWDKRISVIGSLRH